MTKHQSKTSLRGLDTGWQKLGSLANMVRSVWYTNVTESQLNLYNRVPPDTQNAINVVITLLHNETRSRKLNCIQAVTGAPEPQVNLLNCSCKYGVNLLGTVGTISGKVIHKIDANSPRRKTHIQTLYWHQKSGCWKPAHCSLFETQIMTKAGLLFNHKKWTLVRIRTEDHAFRHTLVYLLLITCQIVQARKGALVQAC